MGTGARLARRTPPSDCPRLGGVDGLLSRLYLNRGIRSAAEIDYRAKNLLRPDFEDMGRATALLAEAIEHRRRILIVGDSDADGATGCALGVRVLAQLGADVGYLVPDRFRFGYGLTPEIVEIAMKRDPWLVVTVDNGVSSIDGVAAAREAGARVIVTDHHLPGSRLPEADAVVNPNRPDCPFPSKNIAGVGVMFYVLAGLRAALRANGWFRRAAIQEPRLVDNLDLVALGTVADVVRLDANNRTLVELGLRRIRAGAACPGIGALARTAGIDVAEITSTDIGFSIGPRLNAAGRLDDMSVGIECLLTTDPERALSLASLLDDLNRQRRGIERDMSEQAIAALNAITLGGDQPPAGISLFHPDWHPGVVGILAARVRERHHRPTIAFARDSGSMLKGSGRSIPQVHLRDVLAAIDTRRPDLLDRFGGHAAAAGLTIKECNLEQFSAFFIAEVERTLGGHEPIDVLWSDGEFGSADLTLENAELIRRAGPWGAGFPEPLFDGELDVLDSRIVGERHLKLKLRHTDGGSTLDAIRFGASDAETAGVSNRGHFAYRVQVNEYRGVRSLQLVIEQLSWL